MRTQPAKLFFALLLGLAAPGLLAAAEPDTSRWKCRSCTTPEGWELSTDVGAIYVSDDAPKFGEYTGLEEEGGYADLNLDVRRWGSAGRYLELFNSDALEYGGSGAGNLGAVAAEARSAHAHAHSLALTLPPLGALVLAPARDDDGPGGP